ncbi:copia protein [Tanacetum coccineum]
MDNNTSSKSNDDTVSGNKEDMSYIVAKIHDIERQMIEGELVPVRDNEIPVIPLHVDGQATTMDPFPCLSGTKEVANFRTLIASAGSGADVAISMLSFLKIRNVPLILRKRSPSANLSKEDFKSVPVWVKLHDVHITTFTEDGSSVIATKLGTPLKLDTYTTSMCRESWGWSSFARAMTGLHVDVELKDTLVKPKDTNSDEVSSNNNSGSKFMADVASLSGTKIGTSNLFDVLMMVEKDIGVAPIDLVNSKGDDVNVENSKEVNLGNEENDSENGREEDDNEKTSFMASKSYKGIDSSKIGGGTGRKSLYECWKDDYEDNTYDDDDDDCLKEREELKRVNKQSRLFVTLLI